MWLFVYSVPGVVRAGHWEISGEGSNLETEMLTTDR